MNQQLLARGQATIVVQEDAYTITQSVGQYLFTADEAGVIQRNVVITSIVSVMHGQSIETDFRFGTIAAPVGFASIVADNLRHTITYTVTAGTKNLADDGTVLIPVIIDGQTYSLSFAWAKSRQGATGASSEMLDWVADWDSNRTQIDAMTLITPKLFAGVKNANGTITGVAMGHFPLTVTDEKGSVVKETVDGIYGFRAGKKTFVLDTSGSVTLGSGDQSIRYDAVTGKITFGSGVSLNWTAAINQAKTEVINTAATTAQSKADAALVSAKSYALSLIHI